MAAANCLLSEEEIMCSICLEVLTDPVSTPCGHNFCKSCLIQHWDTSNLCWCPLCKEAFHIRPQLRTNTFISAMVAQFRKRARQEQLRADLQVAEPGEVSCDVCPEPKLKALKSCLVCLASYCQTHLDPHRRAAPLQTHQLIEPVLDLRDRSCLTHNKPLELFCENDQTLVCMICSVFAHKYHRVVSLKEGYEAKQRELMKTKSETQRMIRERQQKIREIQLSLDLSQRAADEEAVEGVQFFSALIDFVQKGLEKVLLEIEEKQTKAKKQAEDLIQALEQEISELNQRSTEVEQLTRTKDHLHVLKTFTSVTPAPNKDWAKIRARTPFSLSLTVQKAVLQIENKIAEEVQLFSKTQLTKVQQFAADVTLDPDTAHPELGLSDDHKQVLHTGVHKILPNNPERCSAFHGVLGKESFSLGRFYFQVQVKGNREWVVGVAKESINRKQAVNATPPNGYWIIQCYRGEEYGTADPDYSPLPVKSKPQKVGVFVDYEEGLVCFYDVDTAALIYYYTGCNFTEKLYPYFYTDSVKHETSAPLIITPVRNQKVRHNVEKGTSPAIL